MNNVLEKCPFCGGSVVLDERSDWYGEIYYKIVCWKCGVEMAGDYKDRLIVQWNRRTVTKEQIKKAAECEVFDDCVSPLHYEYAIAVFNAAGFIHDVSCE